MLVTHSLQNVYGYAAWGIGMWGHTPVGITGVFVIFVELFVLHLHILTADLSLM